MGRAIVVPTKFTAIDKITKVMKRMTRGTKNFANKAQASFAKVERAERRLRKGLTKKLGFFGMTVGFLMLARVVGNVIGIFADFEQANAGLASVMANATGPELIAMQDDAKRLGATTAKTATEVVGLQEAFARLGFGTDAILNMTEATISGSVAMRGELADTAELVGAMIKTFDSFESVNAPEIIDKMTAATQKSALNFEKLQTALPIVASAANASKVPFSELLSLLGKLSDSGIDASSSSTALRNIFLESAKRGVPYEKLLNKITNSTDQLATANQLFGKRGAVASVILAKNIKATKALNLALQDVAGTAKDASDKQLDTLQGRVIKLKSAWEGYILSLEDGTGKFAGLLNTVVSVATEILSLATGTAKSREELDTAGKRIRDISKKVMRFIKVLKVAVITLVALKTTMMIFRGVMMAWRTVLFLVTAAQTLWNIAMTANPIGLIIVGIGILIGLIILIIKEWDNWGKEVFEFMSPINMVIAFVKMLGVEWAKVTSAFQNAGAIGGIKQIGRSIVRSILFPLVKVLTVLEKLGITRKGLAEETLADIGLADPEELARLNELRAPRLNPDAANGENIQKTVMTKQEKAMLEIFNKTSNPMELLNAGKNIKLSETLGWQQ